MNIIEKFKVQRKKRIVYSLIAIVFLIPVLLINYYNLVFLFLPIRSDYLALILQSLSLIFVGLAYFQSFCPSCNKLAGSGWTINECKKCDTKLT